MDITGDTMTTATVHLPPKLVHVFAPPRGSVMYRAMYGGRGSAKSFSAALMAAVWGYAEPIRVLCTREFQASIKESFHAELKAAIASVPWLESHYDVGVDYLRGKNGTEFIFRGLRHNVGSIKSLAKIDLTICEEAEDIPEESWLALEATVFRQTKSEIWAIWNPRTDNSPVDKRFRKSPPKNAIIAEVNWSDNPYFPPGLDELRRREMERLDPATYAHVWEGAYLERSDAQVFRGKYRIAEFDSEPDWSGPYFGVDFGFANDETAAVKAWVHGDTLHIEHELYRKHLETDHMPAELIESIPDIERHTSRADNARPETISYLKRHGLPKMEACKKGKGSVEDGVEFIKSFREVVIHPRCKNTINEFDLYSYKVDRLSGDVLPVIIDAHNHAIDALRYALEPIMRKDGYNWSGFL